MKYNKWNIPESAPRIPDAFASFGYGLLLSALLSARGFCDVDEVERFLKCDERDLHDPFLLEGMEGAAERLNVAINRCEKVAVFGDYDVDGITAGCLVVDYLASRGLSPTLYIPDRVKEGYGLNECAIKKFSDEGIGLIVTVDCGVTAIAETEYAASLGIDMIITDHHECCGDLPNAIAVINPKKNACDYPFRSLAGVGVAFKLICAVDGDTREMSRRYSDLVAVGTVADVVPLIDENRYLVREGIAKLRVAPRPGIGALIGEIGINRAKADAVNIGFALAPRINAAGRLGMTHIAVALLLADDLDKAKELAQELCALNRQRQGLEADIWSEAVEELGPPPKKEPVILAREGWHQGIIGIVASRIAEHYEVPTVMISLDGEYGKGSCRSSGDWSLFDALSSCSSALESFGGHAMAAGLTIKRSGIEEFADKLRDYYRGHPPTGERVLNVDIVVTNPAMLSLESAESLELMEPCGQGNPRPRLVILDAIVRTAIPLAGGKFVRLHVDKFSEGYECVFFSRSFDNFEFREGDAVDLVFVPQVNEYRGRRNVQLLITDIREAGIYELCRRALSDSLTVEEASESIPKRPDFARMWRKICSISRLGDEAGEAVYKDSFYSALRQFGGNASFLRTAIGFSVFAELGLIRYVLEGTDIKIWVKNPEKKVDLKKSEILRRLYPNNDGKPGGEQRGCP